MSRRKTPLIKHFQMDLTVEMQRLPFKYQKQWLVARVTKFRKLYEKYRALPNYHTEFYVYKKLHRGGMEKPDDAPNAPGVWYVPIVWRDTLHIKISRIPA